MATITKSAAASGGNIVTSFVITDLSGNACTIAMTTGPVTGPVVQFSGAAVRSDAIGQIANLCNLMQTGIVPQVNGQ